MVSDLFCSEGWTNSILAPCCSPTKSRNLQSWTELELHWFVVTVVALICYRNQGVALFCRIGTLGPLRVPIYWEFGHGGSSNFCPWRHFVSKLDTTLYSKSMGNSCQLSYNCGPLENEAVKAIKSIHIWKANTITIPNMDMSVSVYQGLRASSL